MFYPIDFFSQKSVELQEQILLKQAQTHFYEQVNTRKWNAHHGGVYVKPLHGEKPNPYLKNNTLKVELWIDYLKREQNNKEFKILLKRDGEDRYFKPHAKKLLIENQELHIIIFDEITKELQKIQILEDEASRDSLTKLFNRGKFDDVLSKEIVLSKITSSPLSIIFLDIDHFKVVNDTYGHDVGDYILIELAKILKSTIRTGDFVARWGGEEFVVTLQSTDSKTASILAEKIRKNVENYTFAKGGEQTVSLGVTQYNQNDTQESFTKRVDDALYEAKKTGRNKVVVK
ncbi:GGDEF domain-containing protein [Sulfurimonas sp.]